MSSILSRSVLRQVLEKAVSYGADFAEVYAEHTKSNRMSMVDGKVETIMDNFLSGSRHPRFQGPEKRLCLYQRPLPAFSFKMCGKRPLLPFQTLPLP